MAVLVDNMNDSLTVYIFDMSEHQRTEIKSEKKDIEPEHFS